jgi:hypothetical protein
MYYRVVVSILLEEILLGLFILTLNIPIPGIMREDTDLRSLPAHCIHLIQKANRQTLLNFPTAHKSIGFRNSSDRKYNNLRTISTVTILPLKWSTIDNIPGRDPQQILPEDMNYQHAPLPVTIMLKSVKGTRFSRRFKTILLPRTQKRNTLAVFAHGGFKDLVICESIFVHIRERDHFLVMYAGKHLLRQVTPLVIDEDFTRNYTKTRDRGVLLYPWPTHEYFVRKILYDMKRRRNSPWQHRLWNNFIRDRYLRGIYLNLSITYLTDDH